MRRAANPNGVTANASSRRSVRLFVSSSLAGGQTIDLTPGQAHYLGGVLRLGVDDVIQGFNGHDGEWRCRIASLTRGSGSLMALDRVRPQASEEGPRLLFTALKKDAIDFLVQKATELGVERLTPVSTRFTAVTRINAARLEANAIEAAEQCGRLTIPRVDAIGALDRVIAGWPVHQRLFVLDPRSGNSLIARLKVVAEDGSGTEAAPPGFLIGPEGGLESGELIGLARHSFVTEVSLGPRILRAETAAIAALACWQAMAGDWAMETPSEVMNNPD